MRPHSGILVGMGTFVLWAGFVALHAGSTHCIVGSSCSQLASKIAVGSTLSAAGGAGSVFLLVQLYMLFMWKSLNKGHETGTHRSSSRSTGINSSRNRNHNKVGILPTPRDKALLRQRRQQKRRREQQAQASLLLCVCRGAVAGLVSGAAGCAVLEPWAACAAGAVGGVVYLLVAAVLRGTRVDDPLEAGAVHCKSLSECLTVSLPWCSG